MFGGTDIPFPAPEPGTLEVRSQEREVRSFSFPIQDSASTRGNPKL